MKPFDKAIIKLTAIYSGILLIICVGFSAIIYGGASRSFEDRPFYHPPNTTIEIRPEVEQMIKERDTAITQQLLLQLIVINAFVLTAGIFASYFLARHTLRPINENMKAQADFVSNASHELRRPLNTMHMENEILRRDENTTKEEYRALVDSNLEEIDALSELCTSLLSLSRNEKLQLTSIDIRAITEEAKEKIAQLAEKKNIKIINHAQSEKIEANHEALFEILSILLENAIKYSPSKSKIIIATNSKKIIVRDQGSGIAEEDLKRIFERFYRAEKSHTTNGHGLGLSIAQHLANLQGLKITAENNEKTGSTFTIS